MTKEKSSICENCGKVIEIKDVRFCSEKCETNYWVSVDIELRRYNASVNFEKELIEIDSERSNYEL